jgi:ABC-type nitrate/sulfonate/bicarbonate transport system substrate-binding protein
MRETCSKHQQEGARKVIRICLRHVCCAAAAFIFTLAAAVSCCRAQALEKVSIVIFGAPSLGAFMPPVIKARKLDAANGLDIAFHERTPDAYAAQFNSGEFKVGGSAALLTIGLADVRGVKVKYLFNLFDYWGAAVTSVPEIRTLRNLEGRQLAAARATTNYIMFEFFAKQLGVDLSKVQVVNTATPGLVGYALANRADAVQIWEPAYTLLLAKKPDIRTLEADIGPIWKRFAGGGRIPYLGVGAHSDWVEQHPALVAKLYATYKAAADWIMANPDAAAPLIASGASAEDLKAMAALIRSNERLAMSLVPAKEIRNEIEAVFRAGGDVGYLPTLPSGGTIHEKPMP